MKSFSYTLLLASVVSSMPLSDRDVASPLAVNLEMVGNTLVKATIVNNGDSDLKLFKTGSLLDSAPVEKAEIFQADTNVPFDGIRLRISTVGLDDTAFEALPAGQTMETTFDVGEAHNLAAGGDFSLTSSGTFSYALPESNEIAGVIPFTSNTVNAQVDGAAASAIHQASILRARQIIQSDCTGSRRTATVTAISSCESLARRAATAARSGSAAKMEEYFKSSSTTTRNTVAGVFDRVAGECDSTTSGVSRQYCTDVLSNCGSSVLAYTQPSTGIMVNCNLYYTALTPLTSTCHAQDQATTTLHETTHLTQVKGTQDYNTYGYAGVRGLSASQNLNHADTYTLFANAIALNC